MALDRMDSPEKRLIYQRLAEYYGDSWRRVKRLGGEPARRGQIYFLYAIAVVDPSTPLRRQSKLARLAAKHGLISALAITAFVPAETPASTASALESAAMGLCPDCRGVMVRVDPEVHPSELARALAGMGWRGRTSWVSMAIWFSKRLPKGKSFYPRLAP